MRCLVTASGGTHILRWSPSGRFLLVGCPTATSLSVYDTEPRPPPLVWHQPQAPGECPFLEEVVPGTAPGYFFTHKTPPPPGGGDNPGCECVGPGQVPLRWGSWAGGLGMGLGAKRRNLLGNARLLGRFCPPSPQRGSHSGLGGWVTPKKESWTVRIRICQVRTSLGRRERADASVLSSGVQVVGRGADWRGRSGPPPPPCLFSSFGEGFSKATALCENSVAADWVWESKIPHFSARCRNKCHTHKAPNVKSKEVHTPCI